MKEMKEMERLLGEVTEMEKEHYHIKEEARRRGNMRNMEIMSAKASAFRDVRFLIQEFINELERKNHGKRKN